MDRHQLLSDFLAKWPLERIKEMTLEEYAVGTSNSHDSFCYWVETVTKPLGNIKGLGGGGSFKFGIFHMVSKEKSYANLYMHDGVYAWKKIYGNDRYEAFENIKKKVIATIELSTKQEFLKIEEIDQLFSLFKWKIAFLYSDKQLLPVYKQVWLDQIARALGYSGPINTISELQLFIVSNQPAGIDFFKWYDLLLHTYVSSENKYYVIGSNFLKKEIGKHISFLSDFYERSVIATDFYDEVSLADYYGKPAAVINTFLQGCGLDKNEVEALNNFLQIEPGDVIAIKDFGIPGRLRIAAFAIVVKDINGHIYSYDPEKLGHCLNVEYIETRVGLELSYTKTHTVHRIIDLDEIESIYGAYQFLRNKKKIKKGRKDTKEKNTTDYWRSGSSGRWVKQFHNQLQQSFFEYLKNEKGDSKGKYCKMEEDYVDVTYRKDPVIELYEVKPFSSPSKCIREAMGQLMYYSYQGKAEFKEIELYVVGPKQIDEEGELFLNFIKGRFSNLKIDYIDFQAD